MDALSCQKDRVIQTFPWIFVVILFIFGFTSSLIGCLLINYPSYLKYIPFLAAIVFELILAPCIGALKSYHLNYLRSELHASVKCYDSVLHHAHPTKGVEVDFDELNLKSMNYIQTTFNCCGVNSFEDWVQQHHAVPKSCCEHMEVCTLATVKQKIGCYDAVEMDVLCYWNAMIMFIIIFICIKSVMLIMYKCSEIARTPPAEITLKENEIIDENLPTTTKKRDTISL